MIIIVSFKFIPSLHNSAEIVTIIIPILQISKTVPENVSHPLKGMIGTCLLGVFVMYSKAPSILGFYCYGEIP